MPKAVAIDHGVGRGPSGSVRRRASLVGDVAHGDECGGAQRLLPLACDGDVDRGDGESGAGAQDVGAGEEVVARASVRNLAV